MARSLGKRNGMQKVTAPGTFRIARGYMLVWGLFAGSCSPAADHGNNATRTDSVQVTAESAPCITSFRCPLGQYCLNGERCVSSSNASGGGGHTSTALE